MLKPAFVVFVGLLIPLLMFPVQANAETTEGDRYSTGDIRFAGDAACYRYDVGDSAAWVEFYFVIQRSDFSFRPLDSEFVAVASAKVMISDSVGIHVDSMANRFGALVNDLQVLTTDPDYKVFYVLSMRIDPGRYNAEMIVVDAKSKSNGTVTFDLTVPYFSDTTLMMSDIELAYQVSSVPPRQPDDPIDVLVKNQRKVHPDAGRVVSPDRRHLHFYTEAYNLNYGGDSDTSFQVSYQIRTPSEATFRDFGVFDIKKPGSDAVLATAVDVSDLPAGNYALRVAVTDPATGAIASTQRSFMKVIPRALADSLTEEDAQNMRNVILYLASNEELQAYDNLNLVGKANFLQEFWARRDRTPGDGVNEFKTEYFKRINEANERYSSHMTVRDDGWRSDMGRIYIKYGSPDDKESYPSVMEQRPIEQWFYFNMPDQGEVFFIFQDEDGYGVYELVHSNARGEIRSPLWERMIQEGRLIR